MRKKSRRNNRKKKQGGSTMEGEDTTVRTRQVTDLKRPDLRGNLTEEQYRNYGDYSDRLTPAGQKLYRNYQTKNSESFNHPEVMGALLSIDNGRYASDSEDPFKKSEGGVMRKAKRGGGSIMVPKEREGYPKGGEAAANSEEMETTYKKMQDVVMGDIPRASKEAVAITKQFNREFPEGTLSILIDDIKESRSEAASSRATAVEGGVPREGLMAMPSEAPMEEPMEEPMDEAPEDTYANATPEEIEEAQVPDEQMEEEHLTFILNESLAPEEQQYLLQILEEDPQLSMIFDKVVETASEFSGSGEVTGPGNGISDSIPARLSDGEFVMTKKATEELGADNLQTMMDDAERAYDGGMMRKNRYLGGSIQSDEDDLGLENSTGDEIRKLMSIKANKTPSLR